MSQQPPPYPPGGSFPPPQQPQRPPSGQSYGYPPQPLPPNMAAAPSYAPMPGQAAMATPQQQQQQGPQQITQAQLGPAVGGVGVGAEAIKHKLQGFFSHAPETEGRNVGFTPTEKMIAKHEKYLNDHQQRPRPLYQFQVTKLRSWRTGYVRLLALYEDSFVTLDPTSDSPVETNRWKYTSLSEWLALPKEKDNILLQVDKDKLKFSCHNVDRSLVLTALLECQDRSGQAPASETIIFQSVQRQTRHGTSVGVSIHVKAYGLAEVHPVTRETIRIYKYTDISSCSFTAEDKSGLVLNFFQPGKSRLYFVHSARQGGNGRSDLLTLMRENCEVLGITLAMEESITPSAWLQRRRSLAIGSVATTWPVQKTTPRHDSAVVGAPQGWVGGIVTRNLTLTGRGYMVERDGGGVVSCRRLADLFAMVRHADSGELTLEFSDGSRRTYTSSSRDALLASILDSASTLGQNTAVHLSDVTSDGYCLASLSTAVSSKESTAAASAVASIFQPISIPAYCLKRVYAVATQAYAFISREFELQPGQQPSFDPIEECQRVVEACREFNASVLPTGEGLPTSPTDKQVSGSIGALWGLVGSLLTRTTTNGDSLVRNRRLLSQAEQVCATFFQTLYRLSKTPTGYKVSAELTTLQEAIPLLWEIDDVFCKYWAFAVLNVLLSGLPTRDRETEYVNKSVILRAGGKLLVDGVLDALLEPSKGQSTDGMRRVSDLVLMVASDLLQGLLCSYHDTTGPEDFSAFIVAMAERYRALLNSLRSKTPSVIENTALLLHLLSTHAPSTAAAIRDAALSSAILLHHFYAAIFSPLEGQRFLSRYLCSLWLSGPMDCDEKRLLKRMVPHGFLSYLNMPALSPMEEEQLDEIEHDAVEENIREARDSTYSFSEAGLVAAPSTDAQQAGAAGTNTARLRARIALATATSRSRQQNQRDENFRIFFHVLTQDHSLADLIWSQQTRRELRIALESEIQYVQREVEARGIDGIAWNHQQFRVNYPSLDNEVKVGNVYMRLWLQAGDGFIRSWEEPVRLSELLFRRFLCEIDRNSQVTNMCVRCLDRLYAIHASKIGPFTDVMILVHSMASTKSIETQHRLLGLLATVLGVAMEPEAGDVANMPENAEQLLNSESIGLLCQFVAWGHTHGDHVGNLLTRVLTSNAKARAMITDGADSGPGSSSESRPTIAADASCPPVWFIASTSRMPPPPELVKGPFRLSDLMRLISEGHLSPFDLVTASHVEEYDNDSGEVAEAHIDTGKWKRLKDVWQLRWQLCTDDSSTAIYSPAAVALLALRALTRLVELHRSFDSRGVPYFPIPTAKRVLCGLGTDVPDAGAKPLSILSEALLCTDSALVDQAADLLYKLVEYNDEAMPKLYLSGLFYFACTYTGSNFQALARLLHATHLKQHFRSGFAAAAEEHELPMRERSILGHMLPEGLLFILVNYGYEKFAEVFVTSADTPEVIWTFEMRTHLIEMIRQHLGDFPLRLFQNNTTEYEYCPMPGVAYKRLEKEIFCHNYYLHNLCDESRFPDWPIAEPIEVFRACLERFKKQIDRDETAEEEAYEQARKVLDLKQGDGSKELRKAYRTLARKFHPDKNPAGRDTFEAIQASYELLLPLIESGQTIRAVTTEGGSHGNGGGDMNNVAEGFAGGRQQMQTMHLLIKTQLLICRRYEKQVRRYKYPAYRILLDCLELPQSCRDIDDDSLLVDSSLARAERARFVLTAVELVFRTCLVSPLNSEELVAESGVSTLATLLDFYIRIIKSTACASEDGLTVELLSQIVVYIVRTFSGLAFYESGRKAIIGLANLSALLLNWKRCVDGSLFAGSDAKSLDGPIKRFAIDGVANFSLDERLQEKIIGSGALWPLLRLTLLFDPTMDEEHEAHSDNPDETEMSIGSVNSHARLAIRALGMLSGALDNGPTNELLETCLAQLLTVPVARMLRNKRSRELLQILNSNVETADIIWNVSMRRQFEAFVQKVEKDRPFTLQQSAEKELAVVGDFHYEALRDEVRIGGIYVRVFNKTGKEAVSRVARPPSFLRAVVNCVARSLNQSDMGEEWVKILIDDPGTPEDESHPEGFDVTEPAFVMAVKALRILVSVDGLVEDILADHPCIIPSVMLSLLELPSHSEPFEIGSDMLTTLGSRQSFADCVAREGALWRLLSVLERPEPHEEGPVSSVRERPSAQTASERKVRGWLVLEALTSSNSVAAQILSSCGWLELLGVLVGYSSFTKVWTARIGAAKTLSRLMWDPVTGAIAAPLLDRFLPRTLGTILKEDPEIMVKQFDSDADTPELIWDASMRAELRGVLAEQLDACTKKRSEESFGKTDFNLAPQVRVKYARLDEELFIGGVYVSRFLKEPTYNLRDPTMFLELLLKRWDSELGTAVAGKKQTADFSETTALSEAKQDTLQLVTTASVYICKTRDSLCDKLAPWGYMTRCVSFLPDVLEKELLGTPLLSIVRLLHVASNRLSNVEVLAVTGNGEGHQGFVDHLIRALGKERLHPDCAFMIDLLKKVFEKGLGHMKKGRSLRQQSVAMQQNAMAPSPAPGDGPVRKRVTAGDDPLAMMMGATISTGQGQPNAPQGQSAYVPQPQTFVQNQPTAYADRPQNASAYQHSRRPIYQQQAEPQQFQPYRESQQSAYTPQMYQAVGHGYQPAQPSFQHQAQQVSGSAQGSLQQRQQPIHGSHQSFQERSAARQQHQATATYVGGRLLPPQQRHVGGSYEERSAMLQQVGGASRSALTGGPESYAYDPRSSRDQQQHQHFDSLPHNNDPRVQGRWQSRPQQTLARDGQYGHNQQAPQSQYHPSVQRQPSPFASDSQRQEERPYQQPVANRQVYQAPGGPAHLSNPQATVQLQHQQEQLRQPGPGSYRQNQAYPVGAQQPMQGEPTSGVAGQQRGAGVHGQIQPPNGSMYDGTSNNGPLGYGSVGIDPTTTQGPVVETVEEEAKLSYQPTPIEGMGIDARSKPDAQTVAQQHTMSVGGAPGCAQGRVALLQQALACKMCEFLVNNVLENATLADVKDPAAAKVHAIDLLKLLTRDPGYGPKFKLILDAIPAWTKYKSQDHSLYITGHEQRADYFLTDGGSGEPKRLLTQGGNSSA